MLEVNTLALEIKHKILNKSFVVKFDRLIFAVRKNRRKKLTNGKS
jgi:hypothetical protein